MVGPVNFADLGCFEGCGARAVSIAGELDELFDSQSQISCILALVALLSGKGELIGRLLLTLSLPLFLPLGKFWSCPGVERCLAQ